MQERSEDARVEPWRLFARPICTISHLCLSSTQTKWRMDVIGEFVCKNVKQQEDSYIMRVAVLQLTTDHWPKSALIIHFSEFFPVQFEEGKTYQIAVSEVAAP